MQADQSVLEAHDISKSFSGTRALSGVSIECRAGEVLGVIGENGAGKSTLMNILTGVLLPDGGSISVNGRALHPGNPEAAHREGVRIVYQEFSLLPHLTVAENIKLKREPVGRLGLIDRRKLAREAEAALRRISATIPLDALCGSLSPAEQQLVEIAKALDGEPRLLILDEPTASLSKRETEALLAIISSLREQRIGIIFISHRLEEIIAVCDRVVVLKDGVRVGSLGRGELDHDRLVSMMVGREWSQAFPPRSAGAGGGALLDLRGVSIPGAFEGVDLRVSSGEVVGIGGLEGQGQRELLRAIFGIEPIQQGEMRFAGATGFFRSPRQAIRSGVAFISDDRKAEGLVLVLTIALNMILTVVRRVTRAFFVRSRLQRELVDRRVEDLTIRISSPKQRASELSGGNQQKVVLAKWLETNPRLLILDEPTRGIDVQTKMQIYERIRGLAAAGTAVIVLSSDMLELIGLSDRIVIIYEGRIAGELAAEEATEERIMALSSGLSPANGDC